MKLQNFITIVAATLMINLAASAQQNSYLSENETQQISISEKKQLNFFIISKRKKAKLDLATRFNVLRTKVKSFLRPKKFVSIVAKDGASMSAKVEYRLKKHNARIGTLWFDSHGMYKKGYSLFFIGKDEYSYKTLKDAGTIAPLQQLTSYTDEGTKLIIGSCYGGATYSRPSIDYKDTTRMNGDSLMIGIGKIFNRAFIYGSESWVMTKPGLFLKKAAVGGYPGRKLFRDYCYQPAWENIGQWNQYNASTNSFQRINPIAMDIYGNIVVRGDSYAIEKNKTIDIEKKLETLEPGLYK
jgi:hypothetical protein